MLAKKPKGAIGKRQSNSASGFLWMLVGAILTLMIGVFLYLSPLFDFNPTATADAEADRQIEPRVNTDTDNSDYEFYDILPTQEMSTIPDEAIGQAGNNPLGNTNFEPDVVVTQPIESPSNANNDASSTTAGETTAEPSRNNSTNSDDNSIVIVEEDATYDGAPAARANPAPTGTASVQKPASATTYILQINSFGNADEADRRRAQVLMAGVDAKVVKTTNNGAPLFQVISRPMNNRQAVATAQQRLQNNGIDSLIVEQRR